MTGVTGVRSEEATASAEALLQQEFEAARYSGFRGGFISRHRALLFSPLDASKVFQAVALTVVGVGLWTALLGPVSRFWSIVMMVSSGILGLVGAETGQETYTLAGGLSFDVPALYVPVGLPERWTWQLGVAFCAAALAVSLVLPRRSLPLAYLLRILVLIQLIAQAFFAWAPNSFPYTASGYIHTMLMASLFLIGLVPVVLGLTYYLFDFSLRQKLALTCMVMGHLTVLVPLQYVVHAFVLYHLSLLFLPILFFAAALPLNVLVFIAFYGWAFSWYNPVRDQHVQWRIRRG